MSISRWPGLFPFTAEGAPIDLSTGGSVPAEFGRSLIAAVDAEFGWHSGTRGDDLTLLVLHHNAADPPAMSLAHKLRMMAKMLGL